MPQSGTNYGGMDTSSKKYETQSIKDQSKPSKIIQKLFQYTFSKQYDQYIIFNSIFASSELEGY